MNCNYLAFEGIDGSGKTTFIEEVSKALVKADIEYSIVREPGGSKLGEGIRELLLSHDYEVDPTSEALLFSASRAQLIEEIVKPTIELGKVVISDRSAYSSVAYQGVGRGLGYKQVYDLNDFAINGFWPEKVILLDIDPKISLRINPGNNMKDHSAESKSINIGNAFDLNRLGISGDYEAGKSLTLGIGYKLDPQEEIKEVELKDKFFEFSLATVLRDQYESEIPSSSTINRKHSNIFGG